MIKVLLVMFLIFTITQADDISTLITKIKSAKKSQKRVLINKLKLLLKDSNIQTRNKVFLKLKKSYHKQYKHKNTHINNHKKLFNNNTKINSNMKNNYKNKMQVHR